MCAIGCNPIVCRSLLCGVLLGVNHLAEEEMVALVCDVAVCVLCCGLVCSA